jgi:hypothetical protein
MCIRDRYMVILQANVGLVMTGKALSNIGLTFTALDLEKACVLRAAIQKMVYAVAGLRKMGSSLYPPSCLKFPE